MGIYDRDYYREQPRGIFLGGPRMMVTNLVIVNVVVYLVDTLFLGNWLNHHLALQADLFSHPWNAWQLVTYAFLHDQNSIWHLAFNMLGLWIFGRDVEMLYGKRQVLSIYLTAAIIAGLGQVAALNFFFRDTDTPSIGASGAVIAVLVIFVIHFPMRTIYIFGVIPAPAWLLAIIYLGSELLQFRQSVAAGGNIDHVGHAAHLAGAAYGALFWKTRWSLGSLLPGNFSLNKMSLRPRPKLRVHEPSWDNEGDFQDRLDGILDKIHREGESSLTAEERHFMEEASRRMQRKRR
ncbi:MAG: rhomboid family intramembrane serine protease [Pirellulales bacterium]